MKEVKCYGYQKFGHYAQDYYYYENYDEDKGVAQFSHDSSSESDGAILMVATHLASEK